MLSRLFIPPGPSRTAQRLSRPTLSASFAEYAIYTLRRITTQSSTFFCRHSLRANLVVLCWVRPHAIRSHLLRFECLVLVRGAHACDSRHTHYVLRKQERRRNAYNVGIATIIRVTIGEARGGEIVVGLRACGNDGFRHHGRRNWCTLSAIPVDRERDE